MISSQVWRFLALLKSDDTPDPGLNVGMGRDRSLNYTRHKRRATPGPGRECPSLTVSNAYCSVIDNACNDLRPWPDGYPSGSAQGGGAPDW